MHVNALRDLWNTHQIFSNRVTPSKENEIDSESLSSYDYNRDSLMTAIRINEMEGVKLQEPVYP